MWAGGGKVRSEVMCGGGLAQRNQVKRRPERSPSLAHQTWCGLPARDWISARTHLGPRMWGEQLYMVDSTRGEARGGTHESS